MRVGLDYHSRIQHQVTGKQSVYAPPLFARASPATAGLLAAQDSDARFTYTLPDDVNMGVYWQATPAWALMTGLQWTDWSVFRTFAVTPTNPHLPGSVTPADFHNTWTVSLGANFRPIPSLMLQTGLAFDQSPVTDAARTAALPDSDRIVLGFGAQYDIRPNLTVQIAYAHFFLADAPIAHAQSATSGVLTGTYRSSAEAGSIGVRYRF